MINTDKQVYAIRAITARVDQAKALVLDTRRTLEHRIMYDQPKISKHVAKVNYEAAQENLSQWLEVLSYIQEVFEEINDA